ncbi:MAG: radical SAM protein [Candidatus Omnitrophota bacterium]
MNSFSLLLYKYKSLFQALFCKNRCYNLVFSLLSCLRKDPKTKHLPFIFQIEPTNQCNLCCVLCPTGEKTLKRPKTNLSLDIYKQAVDQLENHVIYLSLYNMGEPLLNKDIFPMIRYARDKNIFVRLNSNGTLINKSVAEQIIDSDLNEILISLDSATAEKYLTYKKSDGFAKVLHNLKLLIEKRANKKHPFIAIQLLLQKNSEYDILKFKQIAKSLKVDKVLLKKIRVNSPGSAIKADFLPQNKKLIRNYYKSKQNKKSCLRPWQSAVILSNGDVVACCFDMEAKHVFGNISQNSFQTIWSNKKYIEFREKIKTDLNQLSLCKACSLEDISFYLGLLLNK